MKYLAFIAIAASFAGTANADPVGYIEGTVGTTAISTVETKTYTGTFGGDTVTGQGELDFETALTAGLEVGVAGFYNNTIRFGLSWDYLQAELEKGRIVGTVNGISDSIEFTSAEARGAGLNFDNDVHLFEAQSFYNLPQIAGRIRPYLGLGIGVASIENAEDAELAASATAGARYQLTNELYLGARVRFHCINGPTDEIGLAYEPITVTSLSLMLGSYF